jgi:peroxiredoxin-like protein
MTHTFHVEAGYRGGFRGEGELTLGDRPQVFSVPAELRGLGSGTNPEELLLGAAASCFLITLGIALDLRGIAARSLRVESAIEVEGTKSLEVKRITHKPTVCLEGEVTPELEEKVRLVLEQVESFCLVTKALKGNVEVSVELNPVKSHRIETGAVSGAESPARLI